MKHIGIRVLATLLIALTLLGLFGCAGGTLPFVRHRTVCPTCGGTGQFYQPNMFFDGTMWQGMYTACPGCGGSGYLN